MVSWFVPPIVVPLGVSRQAVEVEPADLEAALARDAEAGNVQS
jgi:hypothetical protein